MKITRRFARTVSIGKVKIGGKNPVAIQSMTKVKNAEYEKAIAQIHHLEKAGCEIVRVAVKDIDDARAIKKIKPHIRISIVADIHFNWQLAVEAAQSGADKIRLNPGNIYKKEEVARVIAAAKSAHIPIRVGLNSGSVRGGARASMAEKLAASCLSYIKMIEGMKFRDIVISLKASTVMETVDAYRRMAKVCEYPMHLGVTATGLPLQGGIKSSIACGLLLAEGIGDTLRISLTDDPQQEVAVAKAILESLELRSFGPEIISCPTCGRCEVDLKGIVKDLEHKLSTIHYPLSTHPLKVAVMGCVVNGPGEAKEADIGVAFGKNQGMLFKKGKPVRKVSTQECVNVLVKELKAQL